MAGDGGGLVTVHGLVTFARAGDEAYALSREALTASGDICPGNSELLIRLDPLTAPRRTQAMAALCDHLSQAHARYSGTDLVLCYEVKSHPNPSQKISLCRESWSQLRVGNRHQKAAAAVGS